jgi:hypothetical protein
LQNHFALVSTVVPETFLKVEFRCHLLVQNPSGTAPYRSSHRSWKRKGTAATGEAPHPAGAGGITELHHLPRVLGEWRDFVDPCWHPVSLVRSEKLTTTPKAATEITNKTIGGVLLLTINSPLVGKFFVVETRESPTHLQLQ